MGVSRLNRWMRALTRSRRGQGLVEYGLIMGLIAVVAIGALSATGGSVAGLIFTTANAIGAVNTGGQNCDAASLCAMFNAGNDQAIQECTAYASQPELQGQVQAICDQLAAQQNGGGAP